MVLINLNITPGEEDKGQEQLSGADKTLKHKKGEIRMPIIPMPKNPTLISTPDYKTIVGSIGLPRLNFKFVETYVFSPPVIGQNLFNPWGVDADSSGNIYVADYMHCRIVKYDPNGNQLTSWGYMGYADGHFFWPIGVAVDTSGNVYVSDNTNGNLNVGGTSYPDPVSRIQKFASNGAFLAKLGGAPGSGDGQLNGAMGIDCDSSGHIYVADVLNNRIQKFDSNFNYIAKWGTHGSGNGQFDQPVDVAVDSAGYVYVVDAGNNRIQKFDSNGVFIAAWGTKGQANGQFNSPGGITVDSTNHIFVVECYNHRVQKFSSDGAYITKWGTEGSGDGQFSWPAGITIDSSGNVYVADSGNNRIEKFIKKFSLYRLPVNAG